MEEVQLEVKRAKRIYGLMENEDVKAIIMAAGGDYAIENVGLFRL